MARHTPDGLAFEAAEYDDRVERLRGALHRHDVDALLVTSPANICYLTGYVASWYAPRLPIGAVIHRDRSELLFVDWSRHEEHAPMHARYDDLVLVDYGTAATQLADALDERGWLNGRFGIEWSAPNPVAAVLVDLRARIEAHGAEAISGDWIVDDLRVYKSPAECERIVRAAEMADGAFEALGDRLRPGMTELEVAALVTTLLAERGSEVPAQHPLVSSGPGAWADVHAFPSAREIRRGDIVSVDACGVVDRYHANLSRAFVVGGWDQRADDLLAAGAESLGAFCARARIGESPRAAMEHAERVLRSRVPDEHIWWVGGYGFGLAFPPSWVGHTYLADDGPRPTPLDVGYVSNFETVLFDREAGFEAAAIDTILVGEQGAAPLSRIPRGLIRV